jgi:hypothetical protein
MPRDAPRGMGSVLGAEAPPTPISEESAGILDTIDRTEVPKPLDKVAELEPRSHPCSCGRPLP